MVGEALYGSASRVDCALGSYVGALSAGPKILRALGGTRRDGPSRLYINLIIYISANFFLQSENKSSDIFLI